MKKRENLTAAINITHASPKEPTLSPKDLFDNRKNMGKEVMIIITIRQKASQVRKLIIQEKERQLKKLKRRKNIKRNQKAKK